MTWAVWTSLGIALTAQVRSIQMATSGQLSLQSWAILERSWPKRHLGKPGKAIWTVWAHCNLFGWPKQVDQETTQEKTQFSIKTAASRLGLLWGTVPFPHLFWILMEDWLRPSLPATIRWSSLLTPNLLDSLRHLFLLLFNNCHYMIASGKLVI